MTVAHGVELEVPFQLEVERFQQSYEAYITYTSGNCQLNCTPKEGNCGGYRDNHHQH